MISAHEVLLNSFDQRCEKYQANMVCCKKDFSNKAVHDLRVAIRRLLALLDLLRQVTPQDSIQKIRRELKSQLDQLDELRDIQVMMAEFSEEIESFPDLHALLKHLHKQEKRLLKDARKNIRAFNDISRPTHKLRTRLAALAEDPGIEARALAAVDEACATVLSRLNRVNPLDTGTIHSVRIAFKRLRYMIEIIHPILPAYPAEPHFIQMRTHQSSMGEIQDIEIFLQTLSEFSTPENQDSLQPAQTYYSQNHSKKIEHFTQNMDAIKTIWRSSPDQPFPWQSTGRIAP